MSQDVEGGSTSLTRACAFGVFGEGSYSIFAIYYVSTSYFWCDIFGLQRLSLHRSDHFTFFKGELGCKMDLGYV